MAPLLDIDAINDIEMVRIVVLGLRHFYQNEL